MYVHGFLYMHIFLCSISWKVPKEIIPQCPRTQLVCSAWFLIPFYNESNKDSLEKWQKICKMGLKHLIEPESKQMLKKHMYATLMMVCQRATGAYWKKLSMVNARKLWTRKKNSIESIKWISMNIKWWWPGKAMQKNSM